MRSFVSCKAMIVCYNEDFMRSQCLPINWTFQTIIRDMTCEMGRGGGGGEIVSLIVMYERAQG